MFYYNIWLLILTLSFKIIIIIIKWEIKKKVKLIIYDSNKNVQIRKETYSELYDRVQTIGHESWNRWYTHNFFIKRRILKVILSRPYWNIYP